MSVNDAQIYSHRRAAQYEVIARLAREMTAILDPKELLRYTAQMLHEWLGYIYVHFFMVDQANDDLVFTLGLGKSGWSEEGVDLRLPAGKGIVGWVAQFGRSLNVENVALDARFVGDRTVEEIVSELAVPIKIGSRVLCVLDVACDQENAFDQDDELALRVIADQMAVVLENARLYQRVQASESRYRDIVEHSHGAILVVNDAGQVVFANRQASELLHADITRLQRMSLLDLTAPSHQAQLAECLRRLVQGQAVSKECEKLILLTPYGEERFVEVWFSHHQNADNLPLTSLYIKDVTESHRMVLELEDAYGYLQSIIAGSVDGIMVLDSGGKIRLANPALATMLARPMEQLIGQPATQFFPGLWDWLLTEKSPQDSLHADALYGRQFSWFLHQFRNDEQEIYLEVGVSRLDPESLDNPRWIAIVRDVTAHKHTEKTLLTLSDVATEMQRILSPSDIFQTVATHLSRLGLKLTIVRQGQDGMLSIEHTSFSSEQLAQVEKLIKMPFANMRFTPERIVAYQKIVQTRRPVFVSDGAEMIGTLLPRAHPRLAAKVARILQIGNVVMAPFVIQDRTEGAFFVTAPTLNPADVSAISAFTAQFNIAWENARLYQQVKAHAQDLEQAVTNRTRELEVAIHELFVKERTQHNISHELLIANRALRAEKQRTEAILHSVADGLIVVDKAGRLTLINPAAGQMLGVPAVELEGKPWHESQYANVHHFFNAVFQDLEKTDAVEFELIKADQVPQGACWEMRNCQNLECPSFQKPEVKCWQFVKNRSDPVLCPSENCPFHESLEQLTLHAHRSMIVDETDQAIGTVIALSDVTRLKELDRLKSKFVSSVSHELRTPLTNIKMYLSLLKDGRPEKRNRYLQVITSEAERLERLIQDALDLSRLDTSDVRTRREPVSMPGLIERVLETHLPRAEEKDILLQSEIPQGLPMFLGDPDQFVQVLTNLLSNAVQYTMPGGRVSLGAGYLRAGTWQAGTPPPVAHWPAGEWGALWVSDTGIGISPEEQKHIFERFYRGSAEQLGISGTGLGLAIVNEIVQLHHGHIIVDSQKGVGSIFVILLPVVSEEQQRPRVVVVDDDPLIAKIVLRFLELLGCQPEWIGDGAAGFAQVSSDPPDLLVLDLNLPGMDGLTMLSLLNALPTTKDMPVMVLSGWPDVDEAYLKRLGAKAFLTKPFSSQKFFECVSRLLGLDSPPDLEDLDVPDSRFSSAQQPT